MKTELEENPDRFTILNPSKGDSSNEEKYNAVLENLEKQVEGGGPGGL